MNILLALLVFSVLVFFHEFGHFLLAKRNGVGVREFNIGFGPKIVRFTHKETEYSIGIILFGGACVMEGEEEDSESDTSFTSKSPAARLSILAAGPIFNFLLAFIFALIIIGSVGIDYPVLAGVSEGSPAEAAGLQENDLITGIDGSRVFCFRDISLFMLNYRGDKEITLRYERDGETKEATFWPVYDTERESFMMGISVYSYRTPTSGVLETIRLSAHEVRYWMSYTLASLRMLFQGEVSPKELSGPVGIVNMVNGGGDEGRRRVLCIPESCQPGDAVVGEPGRRQPASVPGFRRRADRICSHRDDHRAAGTARQGRNCSSDRHDPIADFDGICVL